MLVGVLRGVLISGVPRGEVSRATQELLATPGLERVTPTQLERWQSAGLVAPNEHIGLGRGRGSRSQPAVGAVAQAAAAASFARPGVPLGWVACHMPTATARNVDVAQSGGPDGSLTFPEERGTRLAFHWALQHHDRSRRKRAAALGGVAASADRTARREGRDPLGFLSLIREEEYPERERLGRDVLAAWIADPSDLTSDPEVVAALLTLLRVPEDDVELMRTLVVKQQLRGARLVPPPPSPRQLKQVVDEVTVERLLQAWRLGLALPGIALTVQITCFLDAEMLAFIEAGLQNEPFLLASILGGAGPIVPQQAPLLAAILLYQALPGYFEYLESRIADLMHQTALAFQRLGFVNPPSLPPSPAGARGGSGRVGKLLNGQAWPTDAKPLSPRRRRGHTATAPNLPQPINPLPTDRGDRAASPLLPRRLSQLSADQGGG